MSTMMMMRAAAREMYMADSVDGYRRTMAEAIVILIGIGLSIGVVRNPHASR